MSRDERFTELWNDYLEGELDEQGFAELRQLVEADDRLLQMAADSYRTHRLLGLHVQDTEARHEDFVRETMSRSPAKQDRFVGDIMQRLATGSGTTARMHVGKWSITAAAAIVLVGILYFFWLQGPPEIASIRDLSGSVLWTGDGGRVVHELEAGSAFRGGTLESLSAESCASLQFRDGSTVTVLGQSMLMISEVGRKEIHMLGGSMTADIAPQPGDQSMLIHTPTAQLEVLGTQLNVDAERTSTRLRVNKGQVRVTRLADGRVAEVPAEHQVVVSASRLTDFEVRRRPESVSSWQSRLPTGAIYGEWTPEGRETDGCLRTTPILINLKKKPITLHLAALSISRCPDPPVVLTSGGRFRIRGHIETSGDIHFSLTANHVRGGFAGKYYVARHIDLSRGADKRLDIELSLGAFEPQEKEFADSPIGLELVDWACFTYNVDLGLSITSVELLASAQPEPETRRQTLPRGGPPPLPIMDIWAAAAQGNLEALKRHLAAGAAIDATFIAPGVPASGATPLHFAVLFGQSETARFLIDKGAHLNIRAKDEHGGTPLHWAAALGRFAMAKQLLDAGADVNAPDNHGFTPLDATNYDPGSAKEAKRKIVELLRSKGGKHGTRARKEAGRQ